MFRRRRPGLLAGLLLAAACAGGPDGTGGSSTPSGEVRRIGPSNGRVVILLREPDGAQQVYAR
jgi:hypothetical protein